MKLQTLKRTARDWKHELSDQVRDHDGANNTALLAWEILGGVIALTAIWGVVSMMPEMVRYLKIKRM
jgi:hypothetical protein